MPVTHNNKVFQLTKLIPAELNGTPASVHRLTGITFTDFENFTKAEQDFILYHEEGHHWLNTKSEEEADKHALLRFAGSTKNSLKIAFNTVLNAIDETNPNSQKRLNELLKNLVLIDFYKFGNKKHTLIIEKMKNTQITQSISKFLESYGVSDISEIQNLPVTTREQMMVEALKSEDIQRYLFNELKNVATNFSGEDDLTYEELKAISSFDGEDFENFSLKGAFKKVVNLGAKVTGVAAQVVGPVVSNVAKVFGLPVNAEKITNLINAVNPLKIADNMIKNKARTPEQIAASGGQMSGVLGYQGGKRIGDGGGTPVKLPTNNTNNTTNNETVVNNEIAAKSGKTILGLKPPVFFAIVGVIVVIGVVVFFKMRKK